LELLIENKIYLKTSPIAALTPSAALEIVPLEKPLLRKQGLKLMMTLKIHFYQFRMVKNPCKNFGGYQISEIQRFA